MTCGYRIDVGVVCMMLFLSIGFRVWVWRFGFWSGWLQTSIGVLFLETVCLPPGWGGGGDSFDISSSCTLGVLGRASRRGLKQCMA